jgi:hypothetical protein
MYLVGRTCGRNTGLRKVRESTYSLPQAVAMRCPEFRPNSMRLWNLILARTWRYAPIIILLEPCQRHGCSSPEAARAEGLREPAGLMEQEIGGTYIPTYLPVAQAISHRNAVGGALQGLMAGIAAELSFAPPAAVFSLSTLVEGVVQNRSTPTRCDP